MLARIVGDEALASQSRQEAVDPPLVEAEALEISVTPSSPSASRKQRSTSRARSATSEELPPRALACGLWARAVASMGTQFR